MRITPNTTIHAAITAHPELLEVLIAQSPAFEKLRNPLLRRTLTRLTTVQQAAAIAQLDHRQLVHVLNEAIGESPPAMVEEMSLPGSATGAPPAWLNAPIAAEVDVRPTLDRGEEPFSQIISVVAQVPEGEQFVLFTRFEPLPLYTVLERRGFQPYARCLGPEDWEIRFFRGKPPAPPPARAGSSHTTAPEAVDATPPADAWAAPDVTLTIDVRELTPPEPMMRILEAVSKLEPGQRLLVHHARYPVYLMPRLEELGCKYTVQQRDDGGVDLLIQR